MTHIFQTARIYSTLLDSKLYY